MHVDLPRNLVTRLAAKLQNVDLHAYVRYAVSAAVGVLSEEEERVFRHAMLLGTTEDTVVAEALGVEVPVVVATRRELGIPEHVLPEKERERRRATQQALYLLKEPGATIRGVARAMGYNRSFVSRIKAEHGLVSSGKSPREIVRAARERLGTRPDLQLARELGVSNSLVRQVRTALGIPPFRRPRKLDPEEVATMFERGMSLATIARELGVAEKRIRTLRTEMGIPLPRCHQKNTRDDVLRFEHQLGKVPDSHVADLVYVSAATVGNVRRLLGIPAYRWYEKE